MLLGSWFIVQVQLILPKLMPLIYACNMVKPPIYICHDGILESGSHIAIYIKYAWLSRTNPCCKNLESCGDISRKMYISTLKPVETDFSNDGLITDLILVTCSSVHGFVQTEHHLVGYLIVLLRPIIFVSQHLNFMKGMPGVSAKRLK